VKIRRTFVSALAIGVVSVATAGTALATADVSATRLAGDDRYGTSRAIADATFDGTTVAIIASGTSYPDALAASYKAGAADAPVVLTTPHGLSAQALATLRDINASGAIVVGGTAAVSEQVVADLRAAGLEVNRVAGTNRYQTARAIAASVPTEQIGSLDASIGRTALLASGEGFADALTGGPLAFASAFPMLLTASDSLSGAAATAIRELEIEQVVILGGTAAISPAVQAQLVASGVQVRRVAGIDRQATAVEIADLAVDTLGYSTTHVNIARGDRFPDSLSGSANAGALKSVILLTLSPDQLGTATGRWLGDKSSTLRTINVYGGTAAVSDSTVNAAEVAAGRNP
jgi:putative cell wall-binding protein